MFRQSSREDNTQGAWNQIPDCVLLQIFSYLEVKDLLTSSLVCRLWCRVSNDEFLWKDLFLHDWKIDRSIPLAPKKSSWKSEYVRLSYHVPSELSETLTYHYHQVLHVAFSHNGETFTTCSKDCHVILWNVGHPTTLKYKENMSGYGWSYTQFSQYNSSDTLLLVSGVFNGSHATSGEIIIFNITDDFSLQCRVPNKPYDMFGTWYNENYLLAGNLHFLQHLISCSTVWLNKAWQESDSEKKPVLKRLFKFQNKCASSIRAIQVSKCLLPLNEETKQASCTPTNASDSTTTKGNPFSQSAISVPSNVPSISASVLQNKGDPKVAPTVPDNNIHYNQEYREMEKDVKEHQSDENDDSDISTSSCSDEYSDSDDRDHSVTYYIPSNKKIKKGEANSASNEHNGILDHETKLMICTMGSKTYTPHQVGFKIIKPFKFPETISKTLTLTKRLTEQVKHNQQNPNDNADFIQNFFDEIDHVIDFDGHIIGMALSPDDRYLYVNCRPWPQDAVIENPLDPPPIAEQINIHVIDLMTLKRVGKMLRSHKAYTPNNDCFFIFLSVSEQYVGSGAEDNHGYLWDRHYGILLKRFEHVDVVNSVALNPTDPEMFVTVSDDYNIKIWRSKRKIKTLASQS